MTSYANDTTSTTTTTIATTLTAPHNDDTTTTATTPTTAAATTELAATLNINNNTAATTTTTTAPTAFTKMSAAAATAIGITTPTTPIDNYDFDDYSSDGREKTDTTPENIKKIDEIIAATDMIKMTTTSTPTPAAAAAAAATTTTTATTMSRFAAASTSPTLSPRLAAGGTLYNSSFVSVVGLGAAIDESNAKFCFAKDTPRTKTNNNNKNNLESNEPSAVSASVTDNRHTIENDSGVALNDGEDDSSASNTTSKQSFAFTIDHFNENNSDPAAQAARYKSMLERFQNRHRRGASMSKIESGGADNAASEAATPTGAAPTTRLGRHSAGRGDENEVTELPKVKLRVRDRSTSRVRDASKRHSWSPRSSSSTTQDVAPTAPTSAVASAASRRGSKSKLPPPAAAKGAANTLANRTQQFTPRSTAMQLALQKVDFLCPEPPLADSKQHNMDEDDAVSDAGTYTLDGDNYTEEQKDLMNIDRNAAAKQLRLEAEAAAAAAAHKRRPKDLAVKTTVNSRASNVLEVNYYHETPVQEQNKSLKPSSGADLLLGPHQTAGAYLEQVKSRILRNMGPCIETSNIATTKSNSNSNKKKQTAATPDVEESDDVGCFTSVTTSGVLAKQRALDTHPKMTRCASLSTSQIDSSEYVSNEVKLKNANQMASAGGFTDRQKAEYRLNVFTSTNNGKQRAKDSKFDATRKLIATPPETPSELCSDTALLKTAQTKQDWIQEWARNARARSLANDTHKQRHSAGQDLMTRSYNCTDTRGAVDDSLTDDSIYSQQQQYAAKLNKSLAERYRLIGAVDYEYSSDPSLSTAHHQELPYKPPKSPSKIPSPLHTLGRARSASRTRASLQHIIPPESGDSTEDFLQKSAAAINNYQQSLSRKNSIKSPTHSASPRIHHGVYNADDITTSPHHSMESPTAAAVSYRRSPMHRRNMSHENSNYSGGSGRSARDALMTSSINESQLQLLTSGEYLLKQLRRRKNSLDTGNIEPVSPVKQHQQQQRTPQSDSPLRRSSSFSTAKIMSQQQSQHPPRQARPQFQNIYTPPAARHQYALSAANPPVPTSPMKKSASSNNFGQVYSDYDDNLQYYINDEDELGTGGEYYSSGEEENHADDAYYQQQDTPVDGAVPLTNTRLNKALLMRIERSKQKVAGGQLSKPNSAPAGKLSAAQAAAAVAAGLIACPNTPELPRRGIKSATRATASASSHKPASATSARQSMPRDTSLSRLANQVPSSLASAKKQILLTAYGVQNTNNSNKMTQRVQPKYMDISKYKSANSNNFLRKNDSKSTLKPNAIGEQMKRSPSASSMGLSRGDPTRASNRSVRSVASAMNSSTTSLSSSTARASSAVRRDASVNKQKEAEMAMWKRRSTYDPMKAAAEDRRKKEEARRLAQTNREMADANDVPFKSARPANNTIITSGSHANYSPRNSMGEDVAWTLGESSEYGDEDDIEDYVGEIAEVDEIENEQLDDVFEDVATTKQQQKKVGQN